MKNEKYSILILLFCFIAILEVSAQKNRLGMGLNHGTTWGASRGEITRTTIGLKLFYDGEIYSDIRLRMNLDVDLPTEIVQHAIEITALYNLSLSNEVKFLLGGGAGYYLQTDVEDRRRYYSENNYSVIYKPFDGGSISGHIVGDIVLEKILIEAKFIYTTISQDETLHFSLPTYFTEKRVKKLDLNTLRMSVSYYFDL